MAFEDTWEKQQKKDQLLIEIEDMARYLERMKEDRIDVSSTVKSIETEVSELKSSYKEEHERKEPTADEKRDYKSRLKGLEKDLRTYKTEIQNIDAKIPYLVKEIDSKKAELDELEFEISKELEEEKVFVNVSSISRKFWKDAYISAVEHGLAAERWGGYHYMLGILATAISAAVGAGIIANNPSLVMLAGVLSLILVIVSAVSTFLNPEQKSSAHYEAGNNFRVLANKAEVLVDIDLVLRQKSCEELAESLKQLTNERDELIMRRPRVPNRFHKLALKDWSEKMAEEERKLAEQLKASADYNVNERIESERAVDEISEKQDEMRELTKESAEITKPTNADDNQNPS